MAYYMIPTIADWPILRGAPVCTIVKVVYPGLLRENGRCGLFIRYVFPAAAQLGHVQTLLRLRLISLSDYEEEVDFDVHPDYVKIVPPITVNSGIYEGVTRAARNEYWRHIYTRPLLAKQIISFVIRIHGYRATAFDHQDYFAALFNGNEIEEAMTVAFAWYEAGPVPKPCDLLIAQAWHQITIRALLIGDDLNECLDLAKMIRVRPGFDRTKVWYLKIHLLLVVTQNLHACRMHREKEGWELVLALNPRHVGALRGLGKLLARRGRYTDAITLWVNAMRDRTTFDPMERREFRELIRRALNDHTRQIRDGTSVDSNV